MSFQTAEKLLKIDKVGGLGQPRSECAQIWGRVGGQGGGHRRLLESDRNWQESDKGSTRPAPRKGGGGFKGFASCRRPQPHSVVGIRVKKLDVNKTCVSQNVS